jgi:uncharacterized membrane protein
VNTYQNFTSGPSINDASQVIGMYNNKSGSHSFLYSDGTYTTLAVPDAQTTTVQQINDAGEVLGGYNDSSGTSHSFVYSDGAYDEIAFPGASFSTALAINDAGQVAGTYSDNTGTHLFIETDGSYVTVDAPANAGQASYIYFNQLNNAGQLLGTYSSPTAYGPFLYSEGKSADVSVPGVQSTNVSRMNDLGQLIGSFYDGAENRLFLATPVLADFMPPEWLADPQSVSQGAGSSTVASMPGTAAVDPALMLQSDPGSVWSS